MFCYLALQVGLVYGSWSLVVTGAVWVTVSFAVVCDPAVLLGDYVVFGAIDPASFCAKPILIESVDPVASAYVFMAAASYLWVYSHILETNAVYQR